MIWLANSQTIDPIANVAPLAPSLCQGDIDRKPSPVPPVTNMADKAAAITVPAKTALQDTAEREDSEEIGGRE